MHLRIHTATLDHCQAWLEAGPSGTACMREIEAEVASLVHAPRRVCCSFYLPLPLGSRPRDG